MLKERRVGVAIVTAKEWANSVFPNTKRIPVEWPGL